MLIVYAGLLAVGAIMLQAWVGMSEPWRTMLVACIVILMIFGALSLLGIHLL